MRRSDWRAGCRLGCVARGLACEIRVAWAEVRTVVCQAFAPGTRAADATRARQTIAPTAALRLTYRLSAASQRALSALATRVC